MSDATPDQREDWFALATFVVALFYLALVAWFVTIVILATGWGLEPVVITSGSMQPAIRPGDIVLIADSQDPTTLGPGTVITYRDRARSGELTTHRIMANNADGTLRTRGDSNTQADSTAVQPDEVVGVGRVLVPALGYPVVWLNQSPVEFGIWLLATCIAVAVVVRPPDELGDRPPADLDADAEADESAVVLSVR